MRKIITIVLICLVVSLWGDYQKNIKHADTYYWLGIGDNGDMDAFAKAFAFLDKAEQEIKQRSLSESESKKAQLKIKSLRNDLKYQQDMAHDTLFGVFPLNRLLSSSIFTDAEAFGTFEFIDDPDVIAVCNGAEKVVETLNRTLKYSPQYGVLINSIPPNKALENEVRYIFNLDSRFFVHTFQEIASALSVDEIKAFENNEIDSDLITHLSTEMNNQYLAMITINQIDIIDDIYFFIVEADTYWDNEGTPTFTMAEMSFSRDRREAFIPSWIVNFATFFLTLLAFALYTMHNSGPRKKIAYIIMPVFAFFWGRFMPWILNPLLVSFRPEPETLVKLSFWWLVAYGLILICGSMLSWYLISKRARKIVRVLAPEGWTDLALICVGLGLSAYFSEIMLIYNTALVPSVVAITIILVGIGYILGSLLDCMRKSTGWFIIPVLLIAAMFGLIIPRLIEKEIIALGFLTLFFSVLAFLRMRKSAINCQLDTSNVQIDIDTNTGLLPNLSDLIMQPRYQKFIAYDKAMEQVKGFLTGKGKGLLITGPSGRGKSALASALIEDLKTKISGDFLVLKGECPNQEAHLNPYAPLQQALGHISGINFNSLTNESSQIDSVMDSLMDSVIPFSSLLLPSDDGNNGVQSREQLNSLIFNSLVKFTKKKSVILFIDDLQWIDDASADFLQYLFLQLEDNHNISLLVILTSRNAETASQLGLSSDCMIEINALETHEKKDILVKGLGFEPQLAHSLLHRFGNITNKQGEMFFLLSTLGELSREGIFNRSPQGYILSSKYENVDQLPIPNSFAESVLEQLERVPEEIMIIQCAACIGLEFEVEVLVKSLEISRMNLLFALNKIESQTDLIYDVGEYDDIFAFRSSAVLEVLKQNLKIYDFGPLNSSVPQLIREYHARLARVIEKSDSSLVFQISNHYYAAGRLFAEKAIEFCIKAAHSAAGLFQHDNARRYLEMAKECAQISNKIGELEEEFLMLEIKESLIENTNQIIVAEKVIDFQNRHTDVSIQLKLFIAKSFYNAGLASGDQKYFTKAVEAAESLVTSTTDEFIIAECRQMIAISLPRNKQNEIIRNLKNAYKSFLELGENTLKNRELQARIENSLAERLSYGNLEEQQQAEELFRHSIKIKEELLDKPGLARSWGGLGRLFLEENKINEARECFENDLLLCKQIGDKGGEIKMFSFIADCYCREENYVQAAKSYQDSYKLADGLNDKLFAARGLVIVGLKLKQFDNLDKYGEFLIDNQETARGIWSGFFDEIINLRTEIDNIPQWLEEV